jgi:predicted RNase H-like HicB family nuclease
MMCGSLLYGFFQYSDNKRMSQRCGNFNIEKIRVFPKTKTKRSLHDMKFLTTLERDEDGVWIAECPSIPGCVSQGDTRQEALSNIREAIALCLEVRADRGMPLTIEIQQVEVAV